MATDLMKLVQSVLAEKRALDATERQLIDGLNRVLPNIGYRVVPTSSGAPRAARRAMGSAPKNLVCVQCGRRFSHPLHLGRHTAATHKGSNGGAVGARTARLGKPRRARRGRKTARTST